jgi:D-glycero-alpha-D-manno-heptose-7-phosphate kinase
MGQKSKMINFNDFLISANSTISTAISKIEINGRGVVYVQNSKNKKIVASITDGDVRRSLLKGVKIYEKITKCYNKKFIYIGDKKNKEHFLKLLDQKITIIPVLNKSKKLINLIDRNYNPTKNNKKIIRARSPARISLAGGGTDVTKYFFNKGGSSISFTINKYCNVHLIKREDKKIIINSIDFKKKLQVENIKHLSYDGNLDLIKACIKLLNPDFGFEINIESDIKPGSGLGGSAAVSSSVIGVLNYVQNKKLSKYEISELAFQAERIELGISGGWQDQYSTVFGGCNLMEFERNFNLVHNLTLPGNILDELERRIVICDTGLPHKGEAMQLKNNVKSKTKDYGKKIKSLVFEIKSELIRGKSDNLGELIQKTWELKKKLNKKMTNNVILELEKRLHKSKLASGCRLLGTGGGGHMLFFIKPQNWFTFLNEIKKLRINYFLVKFETSGLKVWEADYE